MPIFKILHTTTYQYNVPVKESMNQIRVYPYQFEDQEVLQHELTISRNPEVYVYYDYWGNKTGTFNLLSPHKELVIENKLLVRTTQTNQLKINFHTSFEDLLLQSGKKLELLELSLPEKTEANKEIAAIIKAIPVNPSSVAGTVEAVGEYIFKHFKYEKGITGIETTLDEIIELRSGVCQDFVHLMLQMLRLLGVPCRYVSGYICPNKDGMRGEGATHAWVEAWIPSYGWAGIDPTNNVWVTNKHVKLAVGRNFNDCSPVKGAFKGIAQQKLSVYVSVGYEDGRSHEESTNVRLGELRTAEEDFFVTDAQAPQQQ